MYRKRGKVAAALLAVLLIVGMTAMTALAEEDPVAVINNLTGFLFTIVRAVGVALILWAVVQIGVSIKSQDPSGRANALLTLAGGVIVVFAKEILSLIGVSL